MLHVYTANSEERWSLLDVVFGRRVERPVATFPQLLALIALIFTVSTLLLVYNSLAWNSIVIGVLAVCGEVLCCLLLCRLRYRQEDSSRTQGAFVVNNVPRLDVGLLTPYERQPPSYECPPDYEKCVASMRTREWTKLQLIQPPSTENAMEHQPAYINVV